MVTVRPSKERGGTMRGETGAEGHYFSPEKLDVFWAAVEFASWRRAFVRRWLRGDADLRDQITRASRSIVLNIAEGSGELSAAEKARFYRMARRSATECAAGLVLVRHEGIAPREEVAPGREILWRVVAMLTKLTGSRKLPSPAENGER